MAPLNKTERFLKSFASVELKPEHLNHGDEGPHLREFGVPASIATRLIRWGEEHQLVCYFENFSGRSNNTYCWQPSFLRAAVAKHIELFGEQGLLDLPAALLCYAYQKI